MFLSKLITDNILKGNYGTDDDDQSDDEETVSMNRGLYIKLH